MPTHWDVHSEPITGYRLLERLGRGGYGEVWKAEAPGGLLKAIKFVYGDLSFPDASTSQAARELKALQKVRQIRHPFVLSIERFDVVNGQLVIVTELADRDLSQRLFECRQQGLDGIPRDELLGYMQEAADALDSLRQRFDLQHLDVKPQNLFLAGDHIKVADFGLVKTLEGRRAAFTGGVTPIYACPESFDGWVSRNSDQYSLAIVFQEMLTGRLPFPGPSPRQFMLQHLTRQPDLGSLPEADRPVVARALSKNPEDRFASCMQFVRALSQHGPTEALTRENETESLTVTPVSKAAAWTMPAQADLEDFERELPVTDPSPVRTAIVIGVGRTGLKCLETIAKVHPVRSLESQYPTSLLLIGIDSRKDSLQELEALKGAPGEPLSVATVHCPLRKGNSYLQHWKRCTHLKDWLDPNLLFRVAADGSSNGHRGLGRLAFFDNLQSIEERLGDVFAKTPAAKQNAKTRVFVVVGMGGGTGSGMFIDLCYLVRKLFGKVNGGAYQLTGALIAGRLSSHSELQAVNHWALIDELDRCCRRGAEYRIVPRVDARPERFAYPPAHRIAVFDAGDHADDKAASRADAVESAAEFIVAGAVHPSFEHGASDAFKVFSSVGWLQVEYPEQRLLDGIAKDLARLLCARWQAPMSSRESAAVHESAEQSLQQVGIETDCVMRKLLGVADAMLESPLHVDLANRLAELESKLRMDVPSTAAAAFAETLRAIDESIGSDWEWREPRLPETPLMNAAQRAVEKAYHELAESLTLANAAALEGPGARRTRATIVADGFADYFARAIDRCHQQLRADRQSLARQSRSISDQAEALRQTERASARQLFLVRNDIEQYGRAKIQLRLRELSLQVFLRLKNKTSQLRQRLDEIGQRLQEWADSLKDEPAPESGAVTQLIFPQKQLRYREAKADALKRLSAPRQIQELDAFVDSRTLQPLGGLWSLALNGAERERAFLPIVSAIQQWVTSHMPSADASHCLAELHGGDASRLAQTIRTYFDWSAPPPTLKGMQRHRATVLAPPGRAGDALLEAAAPYLSQAELTLRTGTRCVFSRRKDAETLEAVAPAWLARFKPLYLQRIGERMSPRVLEPAEPG